MSSSLKSIISKKQSIWLSGGKNKTNKFTTAKQL